MKLLPSGKAAELIGVEASTLIDWASYGLVPHYKVGTRYRFDEDELLAWIKTQRVPAKNAAATYDPKLSTREEESGFTPT
jgi:excisionase family DNA binding protein